VVAVGVSIVTFAILHASGDPVALIMPEAPESDREVLRRALGLHDPLPVQFGRFFARAATGDFGNSFFHRTPAFGLVMERMPTTLLLTVLSMGLALLVALPVGIYSAVRRGHAVDQVATGTVFLGQSMPVFWTGIMLILLFSVQLGWLPASGYVSPFEDLEANLAAMIMPAFVLGNAIAAVLMRHTRSAMLQVMSSDYVRTARAKGLDERVVILKHGLRNALTPIITLGALELGTLLSGAVLTEQVFTIPGFGKLIVDAVFNRDYAVVQGVVLFTATAYIVLNLLADIAYFLVNPRLRDQ
jgi:peptide/nickel transport system permease protein